MSTTFPTTYLPSDLERLAAPSPAIVTATAGEERHHPDHVRRPELDAQGLLRFEDRWVVLTDLQVPVVRHLIDHLGAMVSATEIAEVYLAGGGSDEPSAVRSLMFRVAQQFATVGLEVTFARRRAGMVVSVPGTAA